MNTTSLSFDLINALKTCFKKYADFSGRASRSEYWFFYLAIFLIGLILGVIDVMVGTNALSALWNLAVLVPSLAVAVRRLHDTDRSGWNLLWLLLPVVGAIVLLVFFCSASKAPNKYGEGPSGPVA